MSRKSTRIKLSAGRLKDDSRYELSEGFMYSSSNESCSLSAITSDATSNNRKWLNTHQESMVQFQKKVVSLEKERDNQHKKIILSDLTNDSLKAENKALKKKNRKFKKIQRK